MHPSKFYIRYLMMSGIRMWDSNDNIREHLRKHRLFPELATDEVIQKIREEIQFPDGYNPSIKDAKITRAYQQEMKVRGMVENTAACKEANVIRDNLPVRDVIEPLLLSASPFVRVARIVNKQRNTRFTKEGVEMFFHYYFNADLHTVTEWQDASRMHPNRDLMLAATNRRPELVEWKLGEEVIMDMRKVLEEAFTQAYMWLIQLRKLPLTPDTAKMFHQLSDAVVKIHMAMGESEVRMKEMMEQLKKFIQSRKSVDIPSVESLEAYSGQVRKDEKGMLPPATLES